jgi:hypothetical protein
MARSDSCAKPGAVCPPLAWTMSNRMMDIAPVILRWWYGRATPADAFIMGPPSPGHYSHSDTALYISLLVLNTKYTGLRENAVNIHA